MVAGQEALRICKPVGNILRRARSVYNDVMDIYPTLAAAQTALDAQAGGAGVLAAPDGSVRHMMMVSVYYEDTDFSGFVYHANYLKFAERGRSNFLRLCGIEHTHLLALEPSLAFVVGHMDIGFLAPARIGDMLLVETAFTRLHGARLLAEQRILRDGRPIWQARVTAAIVDLQGRPRRLPKDLAAPLETRIGAPIIAAPKET